MNDGRKGDSMQGHLARGLAPRPHLPSNPSSCSSPLSLPWPGPLAFVFLPHRVLGVLSTV